jgi:hypothetical protein
VVFRLIYLFLIQETEAADNPSLNKSTTDPTIFCTANKKNRFYVFTKRDPDQRYASIIFSLLSDFLYPLFHLVLIIMGDGEVTINFA